MNQENNFNQNSNSSLNNNIQNLNGQNSNINMAYSQSNQIQNDFNNNVNNQNNYVTGINSYQVNDDKLNLDGNKNNNKKGLKKGILIGGGVAVVIGVIAVAFVLLSSNNDSKKIQSNDLNSGIVNGSAELVYSSDNKIAMSQYKYGYNLFEEYENSDTSHNISLLNNKGKEILEISNTLRSGEDSYMYYGDNYLVYTNDGLQMSVFDLEKNKDVFSCESCLYDYSQYRDGILYYGIIEDVSNEDGTKSSLWKTIAYDLNKNEELWSVEASVDGLLHTYNNTKYGLFNKGIRVNSGNYLTYDIYRRSYFPSSLISYDGEFIVKGNTDDTSHVFNVDTAVRFGQELAYTYTTLSDYYIKKKYDEYVEVYDLDNNLVSSMSLKPVNGIRYELEEVFDNGMFVIEEVGENNLAISYTLYDVNKNVIYKTNNFLGIRQERNMLMKTIDDFGIIVAEADSNYLIIKDNKILETVSDYFVEYRDSNHRSIGDENSYLIFKQKDETTGVLESKIMNLKTLKIVESKVGSLSEYFYESPSGNYVIVHDDKETGSYVYDSEFNLKYESDNWLYSINDKFVLEKEEDNILYMVNIENGDRNKLDVKGIYVDHSASGLITRDESDKYYLYAFN